MNQGRRRFEVAALGWWCAAIGLVAQLACATPGGTRASPRPTDPDAEVVLASLRTARAGINARPPTWVGTLEPLAGDGARQLAHGALGRSVAHDIANKAAYRFGRNVMVWCFVTDDLHAIAWPPQLLSGRSLLVTLGVALMQTTAPGRYAVIVILPEPGLG